MMGQVIAYTVVTIRSVLASLDSHHHSAKTSRHESLLPDFF